MRLSFFLATFLSFSAMAQQPVLTPFTASYSTTYKLGWFTLNIDATRELKPLDNRQWQLTFDASTNGASISEKSIFNLDNRQIKPIEYHYQTGGLLNKTPLDIYFNASKKEITDTHINKTYTDVWQKDLQDNLTYILQASIDLSQGKTELHFPIFKSDYVKLYSFAVVKEEVINTQIGKLKTIKVERIGDKKDRTINAWFAVEHNFQLVRLNESKKGKTTYQIDISDLAVTPQKQK